MNKKIYALLLLVFVLVTLSAVSAADVKDNNQTLALDSSSDIVAVSNDDSNALKISNDDEIQQISDFDDDVLGAEPLDVDDWSRPNPTMNQGESNPTYIVFMGEYDGVPKSGVPVKLTVDKDYRATTGSDGKATFDLSEVAPGVYTGRYYVEGSDYTWDYYEGYTFSLTVNGVTPSKTTVYLENYDMVPSIDMNYGDSVTFTAAVYSDESV